jgi:hypothetical protein
MNAQSRTDEPGLALGVLLIAVLAGLMIATFVAGFETGPLRAGTSTVLLGVYLMAWGAMFLASYWLSHRTFFLRALIWVCEHASWPGGRRMAFFFAALTLLAGAYVTLVGSGVVAP